MMIILYYVSHIVWPQFQLRATLLLRDAWLSWVGLATATIKTARMLGLARLTVALALAYLGIP